MAVFGNIKDMVSFKATVRWPGLIIAILLYKFNQIILLFDLFYGSAAKSYFTGNLINRMSDMMGIIILKFDDIDFMQDNHFIT